MKAAVAKAVLAFQTTEEYNTILFQWYFKGFELLRRYLLKHGPGTDLENLDFEAANKELRQTRQPKLFRLLARILPWLTRTAMTHLRLDQASLLKTLYINLFSFSFWVPCMFFGLLSEQYSYAWYVLVLLTNLCLFIYDMWVGIFFICSQLWMSCLRLLFEYSFHPYGDLEEK